MMIRVIVTSLIVLVAFFVRSLTGFGGALISVPLLAIFLDIRTVVPFESVLEVVISVLVLSRVFREVQWRALVPLAIGAPLGTLLGVSILQRLSTLLLKRLLAVGIVLSGVYVRIGPRTAAKAPWWPLGVLSGFVGGVLGGMFGTSGPPFVIYLVHQIREKSVLRATLVALFAVDYTWRLGTFAVQGLLTDEVKRLALYSLPALIIGTELGSRVHGRISTRLFDCMVGLLIVVAGVILLCT